jgi:ribosomal protein S13
MNQIKATKMVKKLTQEQIDKIEAVIDVHT